MAESKELAKDLRRSHFELGHAGNYIEHCHDFGFLNASINLH